MTQIKALRGSIKAATISGVKHLYNTPVISQLATFFCAIALLTGPVQAWAADAATSPTSAKAPAKAVAKAPVAAAPVQTPKAGVAQRLQAAAGGGLIGGFVAQTVDFNNLRKGVTEPTSGDLNYNTLGNGNDVRFGISEVGLRVGGTHRSGWGGMAQVHLLTRSASVGEALIDIRRLYVSYEKPKLWRMELGQFVPPVGLEQLDAPDKYQVSSGLVFRTMTPRQLIGFKSVLKLKKFFSLKTWIAGPWEQQEFLLAKGFNIGNRVGVTYGKKADFGVTVLWGDRDGIGKFLQRVGLDVDGMLTVVDWMALGMEFNLNVNRYETARELFLLNTFGIAGMANFRATDWFNVTARADMVADDSAHGISTHFPTPNGKDQNRSSYTLGLNTVFADGAVELRTEGRYDLSTNGNFIRKANNHYSDGYWSAAFQAMYRFGKW